MLGTGTRTTLLSELGSSPRLVPAELVDAQIRLGLFDAAWPIRDLRAERIQEGDAPPIRVHQRIFWTDSVRDDNPMVVSYASWLLGIDTTRPGPPEKRARLWENDAIGQLTRAAAHGSKDALGTLVQLASRPQPHLVLKSIAALAKAAAGDSGSALGQALLRIAYDRGHHGRGYALASSGALAVSDPTVLNYLRAEAEESDARDAYQIWAVAGLRRAWESGSLTAFDLLVSFTCRIHNPACEYAIRELRTGDMPIHRAALARFPTAARRLAIQDPSDPRRGHAIWLLHYLGTSRVKTLSAIALDESDPDRLVAIWALARTTVDGKSSNPTQRQQALSTLLGIASREQDSERLVGISALEWAAAQGENQAWGALLALYSDPSERHAVRDVAFTALRRAVTSSEGGPVRGRLKSLVVGDDAARCVQALTILAAGAQGGNLPLLKMLLQLATKVPNEQAAQILSRGLSRILDDPYYSWNERWRERIRIAVDHLVADRSEAIATPIILPQSRQINGQTFAPC